MFLDLFNSQGKIERFFIKLDELDKLDKPSDAWSKCNLKLPTSTVASVV